MVGNLLLTRKMQAGVQLMWYIAIFGNTSRILPQLKELLLKVLWEKQDGEVNYHNLDVFHLAATYVKAHP